MFSSVDIDRDLDDFKKNGKDMELDEVDLISHQLRSEISVAKEQGWQKFSPEKMTLRSKRANAEKLAERMGVLITQDTILTEGLPRSKDPLRPTLPSPIPIPLVPHRKREEVDAAVAGSCLSFNTVDQAYTSLSQLSPIMSSPVWSSGSDTTTSDNPSSPLWFAEPKSSLFAQPKDDIFKKSCQEDNRFLEDNHPLHRRDSSSRYSERSLNSSFHEDNFSFHSTPFPESRSIVYRQDNQSFGSSQRSTTSSIHEDDIASNSSFYNEWKNRSLPRSSHEAYHSLAPRLNRDSRKANVAECEPSFRGMEPRRKFYSRPQPGDVQPCKSNIMRSILCAFCRNNGEMESLYRSHSVRNAAGQVACPILRAYTCPLCGSTGDYAHTIKYCPKNRCKEIIDIKRLTKCGRSSSGKPRMWSHTSTHPSTNLATSSSPTTSESQSHVNWMHWRGVDRN